MSSLAAAPAAAPRCQSPRSQQTSSKKRRVELEPLSAAVAGSDDERPGSPSDGSSRDGDDDDQLLRHRGRSSYAKKSLPKSPKKLYPRLQTIAQLAESHVDAMHTGGFVSRSVDRWKAFESQPDNQLSTTRLNLQSGDQDASSQSSTRPVSDDARRAIAIARATGSVVIQSAWRRYVAVSIREKLVRSIWKRQMRVAAWISQRYDSYQSELRRLDAGGLKPAVSSSETHADQFPSSRPRCGAYFHLPASILAMWLRFTCARASGSFLRRSPAILQTIDIPVRRTLSAAVRCWRRLATVAAMAMQCCVRSFFARTLYRRVRGEHLRLRAALRLQGFFRVCLARKLATRLRRRRAAVAIQCCWRCAQARSRVTQQRILSVSTKFWAAVSAAAVGRAAVVIFKAAATTIQRVHRGQRARSRVRWLLSVREQKNWLKNPSKGFMLFAEQQFGHAALCLEYCRRQGYADGLRLSVVSESELHHESDSRTRHLQPQQSISGSRMSFSFSSAPTKLNQHADWFHPSSHLDMVAGDADTVRCLRFWFVYALSHFHAFDASGALINLQRSREGWERFLEVCATFVATEGDVIAALRFQAQYRLLLCVFWMSGDSSDERRNALELSDQLLQVLDGGMCPEPDQAHDLRARLLMTSSMISFEHGGSSRSCKLLSDLLKQSTSQTTYAELEVRFVLALLLSREVSRSSSDAEQRAKNKSAAAAHFKRCFQLVELLPDFGYFHGVLSNSDAKQQLAHAPIGSFLLYTPVDGDASQDPTQTIHDKATHCERQDTLLKVKLSHRPLRVSSLRIKVDADGLYYSKKIPQSRHASLHEFVARLPEAAGVRMENGVRKALLVDALEKRAIQMNSGKRHKLVSWRDWERQIRRELKPGRPRATLSRSNETWVAVCLHVAGALEGSEAWVFALLAAQQATVCSRDRRVQASANFLAARCAFHLQHYTDFQAFMRLAHLMSVSDASQYANLRAVRRALSRNVMVSKLEAFESRLERVQKLERMCLKAWRYDSLSVAMRGDPFSEALLLQRIHAEMYSACADTFFLRSLLKAHVRAFLAVGSPFESEHLRKAVEAATQLFERFREHHGDDGRGARSQLESLAALAKQSIVSDRSTRSPWERKPRSTGGLSVDHLLLLWHRIPFAVCFELAEALYRASTVYEHRVIDVYESLYGRLRGAKASSRAYAAFEELILIRLAFLYAQRATSADGAARFLRSSVKLVDELLALRSRRRQRSGAKTTTKRIKWPRTLTLPRSLSSEELVFTRGLFREMLEDMKGTPREQRKSWCDYDALHAELLATVTRESRADAEKLRLRERTLQPRGIRLFIGRTQDVVIKDLLHSKPCISVQCEGKTSVSRSPPTWTSLSPRWDEFIEFGIESTKSRVSVSLLDRGKRGIGTRTIGSVHVYVSEVIATPDSFSRGRLFALSPAAAGDADATRESDKHPQLFLGFQVLFKTREASSSSDAAAAVASEKRMCGNWRLSDLRTSLHGDLETFVRSRWVWSSLGRLWLREQEYSIASWFFHKAVGAAQETFASDTHTRRRQGQQPVEAQAYVKDLLALATCYRATMTRDHWVVYAVPIVDRADAALQSAIDTGDLDARNPAIQKLVLAIESKKRGLVTTSVDTSDPLASALRRNTPASSDWVKIADASSSESADGAFFLNLDTDEYFSAHAGALEPLEFEDKEFLKRCCFEAAGQRPHRITIMSFEMRARVQLHRVDMEQRRVADPYQWSAVFSERRQEMRYFRARLSREGAPPNVWTNGHRHLSEPQRQPTTYAMLADEYMLYNVLLVQDAFRRFRSRKRSGRRLRGIVKCACWFARELLAARRRIAARIETKRKQGLNCLHVIVEHARHLRAGDVFTSDPFVLATVLDRDDTEIAKGKTSVRHNTLNPRWNEEFHFRFDWTEFASAAGGGGGVSALDGDESDEEEADVSDRYLASIGTLAFEVCDYDIIALRKADNRQRGDSVSSSEDGDGADASVEKKSDLLGQASISIASLVHGESIRVEMPLFLGSSATDSAERPRGALSVSIRWTHSREFAGYGLRRASTGIVAASKKPLAKQSLPDALAAQLRGVRSHLTTALEQLVDLAATSLDPLQRLDKRMVNAQAVGKTADEAKVVEQRMLALIQTNLAPKTRSLNEHVRVCMDAVQQFVKDGGLLGIVEEYVDSQVTERSLELTTVLQSGLDSIATASKELQQAEPFDLSAASSQDLRHLGSVFTSVFRQRQALSTSCRTLDKLLTTFFVDEQEAWTPTPLQTQTDEIYAKLEAQPLASGSAVQAADAKAGGATGVDPTPLSSAKVQSKAVASAEKRMERIQKEKRRRQQQQTK